MSHNDSPQPTRPNLGAGIFLVSLTVLIVAVAGFVFLSRGSGAETATVEETSQDAANGSERASTTPPTEGSPGQSPVADGVADSVALVGGSDSTTGDASSERTTEALAFGDATSTDDELVAAEAAASQGAAVQPEASDQADAAQRGSTDGSGATSEQTGNAPDTSHVPATTSAPATTTAPAATAAPTTTKAPTTATPIGPGPDGAISSGALYVDPTSQAALWVANNAGDPRAQVINDRIANQSSAKWFGEWTPDVQSHVADYVGRARAANAVPLLVAYNVPDRDCGQHSSGGASNFSAYATWIDAFANGLGDGAAIIILEPDALALNDCAGSGRNDAISNAVITIKSACTECRVYLDAGHSSWVSPTDMANRLLDAGVLGADGFFTNVSNYNTTSAETDFGKNVLNALGNPAGLGQVIDVSRNGNGSNGEWCDAAGRKVGVAPTLQSGISHVHALLWVKAPGEADGCAGAAGQFVPDLAHQLAS